MTKKTLNARVDQGANDLARDLRALALVGRGEGLVAEQQAARPDPVGDVAHPAELLVELAALMRRVFFALVVREHAVADRRANARRRRTCPHCIISCARPTLRRNVDFPPWLAPVMITSALSVGVDVVAD